MEKDYRARITTIATTRAQSYNTNRNIELESQAWPREPLPDFICEHLNVINAHPMNGEMRTAETKDYL